jgi:hypothetical protein
MSNFRFEVYDLNKNLIYQGCISLEAGYYEMAGFKVKRFMNEVEL